MKLIIEQQVAQAITDYLAKQPYQEVAGFIEIMRRLPQDKETEAEMLKQIELAKAAKNGGNPQTESESTPGTPQESA